MSPEQLLSYQDYLKHQKGLAALWLWMDAWAGLEGWAWSNNTLTLSALCSQRFALGAPKTKVGVRGREVFLGFQKQEALWLKFVSWHKCVWDAQAGRLWLVSKRRVTPDKGWPDLPSVAIGINVDPDRLQAWTGSKLEGRSLWWDVDNILHVGKTPELSWPVKLGSLQENWSEAESAPTRSLRDLVLEKIASTNTFIDPGYQGDKSQLSSELQKINQPFKGNPKSAPVDVMERSNEDLFGQFLDPDKK